LRITGPVSFTEAVFHYLGDVTGTTVTHKNLTGMRTPRLYGDALVLPIDGFATGVPHSGASQEIAQWTMVKHHFSGSWKKGE
jgi:alpha 1,6-mannosyltransferase